MSCVSILLYQEQAMATPPSEPVYRFVRHYLQSKGYPPNLDEIAAGCGLESAEVEASLSGLVSAGKLVYRQARPRGMRLLDESPVIR
jgi:hypothetical protein